MYQNYFALRDHPFAITPDPAYLYMSAPHQEALAHLLYGTHENGGFVQLTGEVGTGKTTLIRSVLAQHLDNVDVALCLNPKLTVREFVETICDELDIAYPNDSPTLKPLLDALNKHLLQAHAQGRQTVLIIDEAQNLSRDVLEQVRLLTNLETHRHKLLRIILVGQPELQQLLERPDMRQLAQRITARYHLPPLSRQETIGYIDHRLSVAGSRAGRLFTPAALRRIFRHSGGIPRLINVICDRALLGAYVRGKQQVDLGILKQAVREVLPARIAGRTMNSQPWWTLAGALAVALAVGLGIRPAKIDQASPVTAEAESTALSAVLPVAEDAPPVLEDSGENPSQQTSLQQSPVRQNTAKPVPVAATDKPVDAPDPVPEPMRQNLSGQPPVEPPAAAPADLAGMLAAVTGESDAMSQLLRLWGEDVRVAPGSYPCEQIRQLGLRCLSGQADWQTLRAYNRPAILPLVAAGGETRQVLLRSLLDEKAVLDVDRQPLQTDVDQLEPLWTGEFLLLWRPPVDQQLLGPGSSGAAVVWLRRQLWFAENGVLPSGSLSDRFDDELDRMVRRFQRDNQLQVDGLVGTQTLLLINNIAPAPGTPLLNVPASGRGRG